MLLALFRLHLPYQAILRVSIVDIGMTLKLLPNELVQLPLLNILLSKLLLLDVLLWAFVTQRVSRDIQIRQEPIIELLVKYDLVVDELYVLCRHKVINYKVLQLQLLLQHSSPLLQSLYLLGIHLLKLFVLVL